MIPEHRLIQLKQIAEAVIDARSRQSHYEAEVALVSYHGAFGPGVAIDLLNMIEELLGARAPESGSVNTDVIVNLHEENDRLRRCLETYANERFWDTGAALKDKGEAARQIILQAA